MFSYKNMTNDEFEDILADIVIENASTLLDIPGVYEAVSEEFNNEVLDRWSEKNPSRCHIPVDPSTFKGAKCGFCGKRVSFNHETEVRTCCDPDKPSFLGGAE